MSVTALQLAALFPPGVVVEVAHEGDESLASLYPAELALAGRMTPARLREFAQGRNAARRALGALGISPAPLVPASGDRHPAWPEGTAGSISHTRGLCAVAVAPIGHRLTGRPLLSLGLDVEGSAPLEDAVAREICRPDELAALQAEPAPAPGWAKLVFAMKEAAYKAWYPETRTTLAFEEMRISLGRDGTFTAKVTSKAARPGLAIEGRFAWTEEYVAAGAVLL